MFTRDRDEQSHNAENETVVDKCKSQYNQDKYNQATITDRTFLS